MPNIDLSILNQRQTPAFYADVFANRPAAGFVGRIFVSTNTFAFYRDNGTGWDLIGGPGTGTITGSGASGQIALWDGASTITGDTGLTYNGTDNSLTASKFIVTGGTSSQFLKADGSLDSSAYLTTNIYNGNGTLSAERTISLNNFNLIFDGGATTARLRLDADTDVARIFSFATNNLPRWAFRIDDAETGSNAGSNFAIRRYNDAGTFVDTPFRIDRASGQITCSNKTVIENNVSDQQVQIVSNQAPSLRIDNLQTGATKRAGLGIATSTNNFIQGSADRDFCMFNGSTTASPILFGIYDTTNVQEAARISAARNFLVGTVTDSGEKLQITGAGKFKVSTDRNLAIKFDSQITISSQSDSGAPESVRHYADTFRVFTATTAIGLTERLSIANTGTATFSGFVGVNGSPGTNFPLEAYINSSTTYTTTSRGNTLRVYNTNTNTNIYAGIELGGTGSTNDGLAGINAVVSSNGSGTLTFYTRNSSAFSEKFRVEPNGNLLIGTTTDNGNVLQVAGGASVTGVITQNGVYTRSKTQNGTANASNSIFSIVYGFPGAISGTVKVFAMAGIIGGGHMSTCVLTFNFAGGNNAGGTVESSNVSNSVLGTIASANAAFTAITALSASITSASASGFSISLTNTIVGTQITDPTYYIEVSYGLHGNASIS